MHRALLILSLSVTYAANVSFSDDTLKTPEWVWGTEERKPGQNVRLQTTFQLTGRVADATMRIAADFTHCEVRLNERQLAAVDNFGPWLELDVTDDLQAGANSIALSAFSGAGPSAVAMSLEGVLIDGTTFTVRSGSNWKAERFDEFGTLHRGKAISFGQVLPYMWTTAAQTTSFDDYTQWKQAIDADQGTDPATFAAQPGFAVKLIRSATADEGSWVSIAFDPQGRLTVAREDKGLLRMTLSDDEDRVDRVEIINDTLEECRGLLYAYGVLYANANNSKGLYRLRDTTGDDQFDEVALLREFPGGVGHGRNDLALGPDGMIYSIHGDSVQVPHENVFDRTSLFRKARLGQGSAEGHLVRTDRDGKHWELVASGLRNAYGIDFNVDGEPFTYDADAEFDMGAPWYRPTRIVHLVSGADYGWRGRTKDWPPYDPDQADNALPVADIGKGSPTSVKSGHNSTFPAPFHNAFFALDWAYGRILACHLQPRGAGYVCRTETFLRGRPFNVTDLTFGPDGAMYVITGGRKTQSALYRIQFIGTEAKPPEPTRQQIARNQFSRKQRELTTRLAEFHGQPDTAAIPTAWPLLSSADPTIRHAAQTAIEHQPVDQWRQRALDEQLPSIAVTALLALARSGQEGQATVTLNLLNQMSIDSLTAYQQRTVLRAYSLCLASEQTVDQTVRRETRIRLESWFPSDRTIFTPVGAGRSVNRKLAELLLLHLDSSTAVTPTVSLLSRSETQEDRLHYLFVLRHARRGWTLPNRRLYFESLGELDRTAFSGAGMPDFLRQIREEAMATLTDADRDALDDLLKPGSEIQPLSLTIHRPIVKEWRVEDLADALTDESQNPNVERGRVLFDQAQCSRCHRMGGRGGVVGPDLSSVASRFARRDLLTSILSPSKVVADKYRNVQVVTIDGRVMIGRVVTGGDYRSPNLRIATDPLRPTQYTEIAKAEIEVHQLSPVSPMPKGLINTFSSAEILDLLEYLESGGHGKKERAQ